MVEGEAKRTLFSILNRVKFNKKACLKPYIDIDTELRKKAKNDSWKVFSKLINNAVFWKNHEKREKT